MTSRYRSPRLLTATDGVEEFSCASTEQTQWLRRHAKQSASSSTTRVFVVTREDDSTVVAYYAWCMAQLDVAAAPERLTKGAGRYPQPVALLARLGVDSRHEGKGLGAALLVDAVTRLLTLSDDIGCRGLLIHAESSVARDFYLHLVPELEQSPTDELHLVLLLKDARRTLLGD
ncbi:MAG: GNAT family N-acetyltransferase [Acidimicrobiaceae bacterium]|nr:GNAT family N-acetyltransferase [Acidimicrobiaceae bacterium]